MLKFFLSFKYTPASYALIAMNLVPLIGVINFGWSAGLIVFLYWMENVVIGLLNIPKLLSCRGELPKSGQIKQQIAEMDAGDVFARTQPKARQRPALGGLIFLAVFFSFHYGMFCFGHYMFIQSSFRDLPSLTEIPAALMSGFLLWTLLGLALSHIVSMIVNFYGKGEYLTRSPNTQMFLPYTRIIVLHAVIILGGFLSIVFNEGLGTLIMLVILKTVFDLAAHQIEHSNVRSLINPKLAED